MQRNGKRFAVWSVDWEDNAECFRPAGRFVAASREFHELLAELSGGRVTWYAKVDFVSDITDHDGLADLVRDIRAHEGEIGLHVHHFSWEPYWRERSIRRGARTIKDRLGVAPTSYSSGMGNYMDADTRMLMACGFKDGRLLYPWLRHSVKASFESNYAGLAGMDLFDDPRGIAAGYVDPADYRRYTSERTVINFPQTRLAEYQRTGDAQHQLTLGVNTEPNSARLVAFAQTQSRFVHAYGHPSDVVDKRARVTVEARKRMTALAKLLRAEGYAFVTAAQARAAFERHGECQGCS